jgi:hypothetical protein
MSDNVFILGAGASCDAGIPLLGGFMDRMIEMALTGRNGAEKISNEDRCILMQAVDIRDELENYHPRVSIDQFNLEEVLSILAFESYAGAPKSKNKLKDFTKAIARTIEITCEVKHDGATGIIQESGSRVYRIFWDSLLSLYNTRLDSFPDIITFNYDLVLERSLFQLLIGHEDKKFKQNRRFEGIKFDYKNAGYKSSCYALKAANWRTANHYHTSGLKLDALTTSACIEDSKLLKIPYYKLHGSLNFPAKNSDDYHCPVLSIQNPRIIPPVFNKTDSSFSATVWNAALNSLRNCKNLIICGYSLPVTDTYMQYFLKAALGPNKRLNKIYVFDPALFGDDEIAKL